MDEIKLFTNFQVKKFFERDFEDFLIIFSQNRQKELKEHFLNYVPSNFSNH